ncbi:MAG: hypothetical protein IJX15_03285 [Ruminiclostridium sp.]|nr:hypothetical protein [Ruminiclostridium sp.]
MKFKIKHENPATIIVCFVSIILAFLILFIFSSWDIALFIWIGGMGVGSIAAAIYFIEQLVGTAIIINDRTIIIKHLIRRKKISVQEICDIDIEKYKRYRSGGRYRRSYTEYRMRMTINLLSGKLVLTDKATAVRNHFLSYEYEEIPDEEVNLHKAYLAIRQRCIKYNNWQVSETENPDSSIR